MAATMSVRLATASDDEVNPATSEAQASLLAAVAPSHIAGPESVTVDSTTNGKSLATLLGGALNVNTTTIRFTVPTAGIYWAYGNASASSCPLLTGVNEITGIKDDFDLLKFYAASDTIMFVEELG